MSDFHQQEKRRMEESLRKGMSKQSVTSLNESGMERMREQYENALVSTEKLTNAFDFNRVQLSETDKALKVENLNVKLSEERQLSLDKRKQNTHSGKMSDQEKAANERGVFKVYTTCDYATARNVLQKYEERKEAIAEKGNIIAPYKCAGDEFNLPPVANMTGMMPERIVSVMVERDRLKAELKKKTNGMTPYQKARRNVETDFLALMEDMINTYFTACGIKQTGNGTVKKKEKEAAKKHMQLAMEKYELFARTFEDRIIQETAPAIKKTEEYRAKKREDKDILPSYTVELTALKNLVTSHPEVYNKNKQVIEKALAEYENFAKKKEQTEQEFRWNIAGIEGEYAGGQDREEINAIKHRMMEKMEKDVRILNLGSSAAISLVKYLTEKTPVDALEAMYIKNTYKLDVSIRYSENISLDMNKSAGRQDVGFSEFDSQEKKKLNERLNERLKKQGDANREDPFAANGYASRHYKVNIISDEGYNVPEFNRTGTLHKDLCKKNGIGMDRAMRDVSRRLTPMKGKCPYNDEEFEEQMKAEYLLSEGKKVITGQDGKPSIVKADKDEMYKVYKAQLPTLRKYREELRQMREAHPEVFGYLGSPREVFQNYGDIKICQGKSEAIAYYAEHILSNAKLMSMLSDMEWEELFQIKLEAGCVDTSFGGWFTFVNKVGDFTPNQIIDGEYDKWRDKFKTMKEPYEDKMKNMEPIHRAKYEKIRNNAKAVKEEGN